MEWLAGIGKESKALGFPKGQVIKGIINMAWHGMAWDECIERLMDRVTALRVVSVCVYVCVYRQVSSLSGYPLIDAMDTLFHI